MFVFDLITNRTIADVFLKLRNLPKQHVNNVNVPNNLSPQANV